MTPESREALDFTALAVGGVPVVLPSCPPIRTIMGSDFNFEGKMSFTGTVTINGHFKGDIVATGHLIIGEGGRVDGDIRTESVEVRGAVMGKISAVTKIELFPPAVVQGDLQAPILVIGHGAFFHGSCFTRTEPAHIENLNTFLQS